MLKRRSMIAGGCGVFALIGFPYVGSAQTQDRQYRIGVMGAQPLPIVLSGNLAPFVEELEKLGYSRDRNITFDVRSSEGDVARFPALASELVALNPQLILATNTPSIIALKKTGTSIPIVFTMIGSDPVNLGVVQSIPRPGGNFTGIINNTPELSAKRLQMLSELVPGGKRIAMFHNPLNPASAPIVEETTRHSGLLGVEIIPIEVKRAEDIPTGIDRALTVGADALIKTDDLVTFINRKTVIELTQQKKLPTMYNYRIEAIEGGLISCGVDADAQYRRAAAYVAKILRGTKPADLPVEQANRILLVINLKTATAIGVRVPAMLVARADEVVD